MNDRIREGPGPACVLFLGFWGVHDPLTTSTILPGVRLLLEEFGVRKVILGTVEREGQDRPVDLGIPGLVHLPWAAHRLVPKVLSRLLDQLGHVRQLTRTVRREGASLIIARASTAGSFGYTVSRLTGVPLVVESFEPHADYMADCGEWDRRGVMYRMSHRMEARETAHARFLITVSHSYREHLIAQGVETGRVLVAPCPVPLEKFRYDTSARAELRTRWGCGDEVVGIYAGKFGGLYHRESAYATFAGTYQHYQGRFRLVVLTPDPIEVVKAGIAGAGIPLEKALVTRVPHEEMPRYLSASDIAFALYRRTPSSAYLSPVKIGEYWASGLPVLLTRGVADDGVVIEREGIGGALFDPEGGDLSQALTRIDALRMRADHRALHAGLALRHRSIDLTRQAYAKVVASLAAQRIR